MSKASFDEMLQDVAGYFGTPTEVVNASNLSREQKLTLLEQWDCDLRRLLAAVARSGPGEANLRAAEMFRQVHKAGASLCRSTHDPVERPARPS